MLKELLRKITQKTRKAATEIEYLLIISLVSVAAIFALMSMSGQLKILFNGIHEKLIPVSNILNNQ